ncbi:hypothetical protein RHGRI_000545 [Rhododendron griersonianum]|uniref:Uncharacterized protein n=1 Tax=Rhododendron griersonianum TaxID=479676 RepID=A0AAV6JU49_9ERIC|nr:hypothetical protein RHGRI_016435 [Rhododendron griersonianum]KAG5564385.1 hypothetical protein RHGRI_000545 [Rhododendron griersonianum]
MVSSEMGFPSLKIATFSKKGNARLSSPSPLYAQMSTFIIGKAQKMLRWLQSPSSQGMLNCRDEPGSAVETGELRGAQIHVLLAECLCSPNHRRRGLFGVEGKGDFAGGFGVYPELGL